MGNIAIRTDDLGKRYRIGELQHYKALRDTITDALYAPFRAAASIFHRRDSKSDSRSSDNVIWAIKDISFDIHQGEVVGIIGRNGAGKSTLLKILSRITEPTVGRAEIHGRVGSLLEVGTGFHPELTGRENIYLNGAIIGMRRAEIKRKFDEILAFAEIEKFIDTPAKFYSSGMYMRLAFAVAAHLEPEILLVDEVLAVGDAAFQKKCLGKMEEVAKEGRTVCFVSHNMPAITRLCQRTILLDQGRILSDGPSHQVVTTYLKSGVGTSAVREWPDLNKAPGNDLVRLRAVRIRKEDGSVSEVIDIRQSVGIEMEYEVLRNGAVFCPGYSIRNEEGVLICWVSDQSEKAKAPRSVGRFTSTAWIPGNLLTEGMIVIGAAASIMAQNISLFHERDAVAFQVVDSMEGDSARGEFAGPIPGVIRPLLRWSTNRIDEYKGPT